MKVNIKMFLLVVKAQIGVRFNLASIFLCDIKMFLLSFGD